MNAPQLRNLPGWKDTPESEAAAIAHMGAERWSRAGGLLVEGGRPCLGPMLMLTGEVQVMLSVGEYALPIQVLRAGDWFSVDACFDQLPASLSVLALVDAKAFLIPREAIDGLRQKPTPVGLRLMRTLAAAQVQLHAGVEQHVANWNRLIAAKRTLTKQDLLDLGMNRLAAAGPSHDDAQRAGRTVELVTHEGPAIAASFRPMR